MSIYNENDNYVIVFFFTKGYVYAPSFDHGVGDPVEDDILVNIQ